jgi:hypothetical protein
MKRLIIVASLMALPVLAAPEKWWDAYSRGVKAVNARSYEAAAAALQKSISEMPTESTGARTKNEIITYVPHFWLGIAKFNLGDIDAALREFKISEEQGAIAKTAYYAQLRDWVSRAQAEKVRNAQAAAGDSKKAADAALTKATFGQAEALAAGGDRSESYRAAVRKLQEALGVFRAASTDIKAYNRAEETAVQARDLFAKATDEGKKLRASRAAAPKAAPPAVAVVQQQPAPPPVVVVQQQPPPPPPVVEMKKAEVEVAVVEPPKPSVKRDVQTLSTTRTPIQQIVAPEPKVNIRSELETAYRAYAVGRFDASERALSSILNSSTSGEAYLLRGCARYTRATLSKNEALLSDAKSDFKAALKINRNLRLDKSSFSPKLVAFFDQVRKNG